MTSAEIAAWVAAGAAVVQAVGALAAIGAAIILADQSAKRERAANEAADKRSALADQRAEERIIATEHAAEVRSKHRKIETHNRLVELVLAAGRHALNVWVNQANDEHSTLGGSLGTIIGGFYGPEVKHLLETLSDVRRQTADTKLLDAMRNVELASDRTKQYQGQGYPAYAVARDAALLELRSAVEAVADAQWQDRVEA